MGSGAPIPNCEFIITEKDGVRFTVKDASIDWSVKHLKATIQTEKNLSWDTIELCYNGKVLNDNKKLASYNVKPGNAITMSLKTGYVVQDYGTKKIYFRQATDNWTVAQLISELVKVVPVPAGSAIKLMYRATMLQPNRTLGSYKVQPGDCINMAVRVTGGVSGLSGNVFCT